MNQWIYDVYRSGGAQGMYDTLGTVGTVIAVLFTLFHMWKLKIPMWKALILLAGVYFGKNFMLSAFYEVLLEFQQTGFLGIRTVTNSIVRLVVFIPLLIQILALLLNIKWRLACDGIAMFVLLQIAFAQPSCLFTGCCRGYECSWGIYVAQLDGYYFPVPLLETFLSLVVFAWLMCRTVKRKYVSDGKLYPLMMILYGAVRLLCEYLRDNEKLALGCSGVGFHAIFMCVVGIVWLLIERAISKRKNQK